MAFIGSLMTLVKANTSNYDRNMKRSGKNTARFGKQIKAAGTASAKFGLAIGTGVAIALTIYTVRAFKAIDATAKLARELGIGTATLTGYHLAAGLSGVSNELLNKSLEKMAKIVGEARLGVSTGTLALRDFGIELKDLEGLTTQGVFEKFTDEIAKIPDPMERAAKASLIFGRAGIKLLNFLSLGSEGLAKVKKELDEMGISFNEIDAAKVEAANDAILKMTTISDGLGNTLAIAVAPHVEAIANKMTDFIKASGGIDNIVNKSLAMAVDLMADLAAGIDLARTAWNTFAGFTRHGMALILDGIDLGIKKRKDLEGNPVKSFVGHLSDELHDLADKDLDVALKGFERLKAGASGDELKNFFKQVEDNAKKSAQALEDAAKKQKILNEGIAKQTSLLAKQKKDTEEAQKSHKKVIAEAMKIFSETRTPLEKLEQELKDVMDIVAKGGFEGIENALQRKIDQIKAAKDELLKAVETEGQRNARMSKEDAISQAQSVFDETLGPMGKLLKEMGDIQKLFDEGAFKGLEEGFERKQAEFLKRAEEIEQKRIDAKNKIDEQKKVGGFQVIDLRHIDIKGLDRSGDINKKQLEESKKTNVILKDIADKTGSTEIVAS